MTKPMFDRKTSWVATPPSRLPSWAGAKRVAVDTETHDPKLKTMGPGVRREKEEDKGKIVGVSFAIEDGPAHYVPVGHRGDDNVDAAHAWAYLRDQAAAFKGEVVGANLSYDLDYLAEAGVNFTGASWFRDVLLAAPLLDELQLKYSLQAVAKRAELEGKSEAHLEDAAVRWDVRGGTKAGLWELPARHVAEYAIQDAALPLQLLRRQEKRIEVEGLGRVWDLESRLLPVLVRMRRRGVAVDTAHLEKVRSRAETEEKAALASITKMTKVEIAPEGVWQEEWVTRALAYIGIKAPLTETGKPQTNADFLEGIDHDVARLILRARKMNKLRTTFCASIDKYMVKKRIHCVLNQLRAASLADGDLFGAKFGRMSSAHPNLQQQPARDPEIGKFWRTIYVPDDGKQWASCDFSCYDAETEILTERGWVRFPELTDERVAQWGAGTVTYTAPLRKISSPYTGEMVSIRGDRQVDVLVTPNHSCVLLDRHEKRFDVLAGGLSDLRGKKVPQSGILSGGRSEDANLLRLIVAIQADSSRRATSYRFFLKRENKIARLAKLLDCLGAPYTRGFSAVKGDQTWFDVRDSWAIDKYLGPFKTFRREVLLSLDTESRRVFLEELLLWDGSSAGQAYFSSNLANCEVVQEIATLTGYRSNFKRRFPERKKIAGIVSLNKTSGTWGDSLNISRQAYSGMVYCVTVPTGAIVVRRNGRVAVSGNSQEPRFVVHYAALLGLRGARELAAKFHADSDLDLHQQTADLCGIKRKAAKTIFLGLCLAEGTLVHTAEGVKPIEAITADDLLWDGGEFVAHGGVIRTGEKQCVKIGSIWLTPDHEILTPDGWYQARDLCTANRLPGWHTENLPSSISNWGREGGSSPSSAVARVVELLIPSTTISSLEERHAVLSVVKRRLLRHVHDTGLCQNPIVLDFLAELVGRFQDAAAGCTNDTACEESLSSRLGSLTDASFSDIWSRYQVGMTRLLKLTESTTTEITRPETCGSSRTVKSCRTLDVIGVGPRNRFCVGDGMIVSNCYGMGGGKLCRSLGLPTEWVYSKRQEKDIEVAGPEGQAILDKFDAMVPFVRALAKRATARAKEVEFVRTLLGRRCRFPPDLKRSVGGRREIQWAHKALNRVIQGSSADQTKMAMVKVDEAGHELQLQVHDELCLSVRDKEQAEEVKRIMEGVVSLAVPSKVDIELGSSWGDSMGE